MSKTKGITAVNIVSGKMFAVDKKYLKAVSKKIGRSFEQTLHVLLNEHAQMSKGLVEQGTPRRRVVEKKTDEKA